MRWFLLGCRSHGGVLIVLLLGCLARNIVHGQNSIKPRRSKSKEGVPTCPEINTLSESPCKMSCTRHEHCDNHGERMCCPAAIGSSCKAECLLPVLTHNGGGTCYDFELDRKYRVGHVFIRDDICCRCVDGGRMNCSATETCIPGCFYSGLYYNDGEAISKSTCRNCSCHNGEVKCKWNTNCTQEKCKYKGKVYKLEHVVPINGCKKCICHFDGWHCTALTCAEYRVSSAVSVATQQSISLGFVCLIQYLLLQRRYR